MSPFKSVLVLAAISSSALSGCNKLDFSEERISLAPLQSSADTAVTLTLSDSTKSLAGHEVRVQALRASAADQMYTTNDCNGGRFGAPESSVSILPVSQLTDDEGTSSFRFSGATIGRYFLRAETSSPNLPAITPDCAELTIKNENYFINRDNSIVEMTPLGQTVAEVPIPYRTGHRPSNETSMDLATVLDRVAVVDGIGRGMFEASPYLSLYNPATRSWTHHVHDGWGDDGAFKTSVSSFGQYLFAFDTSGIAPGQSSTDAILRFDSQTNTFERFFESNTAARSAMTVGADGLLYVLDDPSLNRVNVINPLTMEIVRSITLGVTPNAGLPFWDIAVNKAGEIFATRSDFKLYRFTAAGAPFGSTNLPYQLNDVDVNRDGEVIVSVLVRATLLQLLKSTDNFSTYEIVSAGVSNTNRGAAFAESITLR